MPEVLQADGNGVPARLLPRWADSPDLSVEDGVRRLARETLAEADLILREIDDRWAPPPFDPFLVAQALGVRCIPVAEPWLQGAMISLGRRPTIYFHPGMPRDQLSSTIFHELAHTLFPDYPHNRVYWRATGSRLFGPEGLLEHLCDLAATEFLLPMEQFRQDLAGKSFGACQVEELCRRYSAPAEAVCLRMVEADAACCALVFLDQRCLAGQRRWRGVEVPEGGQPKDRRRAWTACAMPSAQFRRQGWVIPSRLALDTRSCIDLAARSRKPVSGEERLDLGEGKVQRFRVEAMPRTSRKRRRGRCPVLAFFYPAG